MYTKIPNKFELSSSQVVKKCKTNSKAVKSCQKVSKVVKSCQKLAVEHNVEDFYVQMLISYGIFPDRVRLPR